MFDTKTFGIKMAHAMLDELGVPRPADGVVLNEDQLMKLFIATLYLEVTTKALALVKDNDDVVKIIAALHHQMEIAFSAAKNFVVTAKNN
jgi:hypothetical protein